jgi:hypothetical protein
VLRRVRRDGLLGDARVHFTDGEGALPPGRRAAEGKLGEAGQKLEALKAGVRDATILKRQAVARALELPLRKLVPED